MERRLINTSDGSKTLYLPELDEQYHSVNGAKTESEFVFLKNGYDYQIANPVIIFEVGFGTGLNAFLTGISANKAKRKTIYYSLEKYPVSKKELKGLQYEELFEGKNSSLFNQIHEAEWHKKVNISEYFTIHKIKDDLLTFQFDKVSEIDLIYFDAFAPDKQPKLWTYEIFKRIYDVCRQQAVFVTYSAKGEVRRQLSKAGFVMERLPGPPGKRQMLRGIKK